MNERIQAGYQIKIWENLSHVFMYLIWFFMNKYMARQFWWELEFIIYYLCVCDRSTFKMFGYFRCDSLIKIRSNNGFFLSLDGVEQCGLNNSVAKTNWLPHRICQSFSNNLWIINWSILWQGIFSSTLLSSPHPNFPIYRCNWTVV